MQLPQRQRLARGGAPLTGAAALRAGRRRFLGGPHGGIVGEVLLQQPGGQFLAQGGGPLLALGEGDQLCLFAGIKQEVEGGLGLLQPLLAKTFTKRIGGRGCWLHGGARG
jgi:hypothetical protein